MAIERKTIVNQIEIDVSGNVGVRLSLQLIENGEVLSSKWHRTMIPTSVSPAEQLAYVNGHLAQMGEALLTTADIQRVGMFHRLSVEMPSENAPAKSLDEAVAEIKEAKESTKVDAS